MATTYFVCPSTGDDGNLGTSFGAGNAWKSTQFALDNATTAGDEIRLCAEISEVITVQIDDDTGSGSTTAEILARGMDGTDGTTPATYTITTSTGITSLVDQSSIAHKEWRDVVFDANASATYAFQHSVFGEMAGIFYKDCRFTDAVSHGVFSKTRNAGVVGVAYQGCEFDANGGGGHVSGQGNGGGGTFIGCSSHDNTGVGFDLDSNLSLVLRSAIYDNGSYGVEVGGSGKNTIVINCTIYDNGNHGIYDSNSNTIACFYYNNSFAENGGNGLFIAGAAVRCALVDFNHFHNNTSGHCNLVADGNINDGTVGTNNATGDPLFESVSEGSEDFEPGTGSPLKEAAYPGALPAGGTGYLDIGALQHEDTGGGGGGIANLIDGGLVHG